MVKGRSMRRAAHRMASVMSMRRASRRALMARLRSAAMILGPDRDLGFVFLIEGVADPVQGLDRPLFPDVSSQLGGACPIGFRAGDTDSGDG
jgi:hypothetical protein